MPVAYDQERNDSAIRRTNGPPCECREGVMSTNDNRFANMPRCSRISDTRVRCVDAGTRHDRPLSVARRVCARPVHESEAMAAPSHDTAAHADAVPTKRARDSRTACEDGRAVMIYDTTILRPVFRGHRPSQ